MIVVSEVIEHILLKQYETKDDPVEDRTKDRFLSRCARYRAGPLPAIDKGLIGDQTKRRILVTIL